MFTRPSGMFSRLKSAIFPDTAQSSKYLGIGAALKKEGYDIGFQFIPRFPDAPGFQYCLGRFADETHIAHGFDLAVPERAFMKALHETVERMLWISRTHYWKEDTVVASIKDAQEGFLQMERLAGFPDNVRHADRRLRVTDTTVFQWSKGTRISDQSPLWVPTQLVSALYARENAREPVLRTPSASGLAAHASVEAATYHGLLELVERDACMIMFYNRIPPSRLTSLPEEIRTVLGTYADFGFTLEVVRVPTDAPTHVMCAILEDPSGEGPPLSFGAKAHHEAREACLGAITEAHGAWHLARIAYAKGAPRQNTESFERIQYWQNPDAARQLAWMREGPIIPFPAAAPVRDAATLARALETSGVHSAMVNMTPSDLARRGIHAVCVVSPELQPMPLGFEDYSGGARRTSLPRVLGLPSAAGLPSYPHPFS